MSVKLVIFLTFVFIVGTMLSLVLEGGYVGAEEVTVMNQLTGYSSVAVSGPGVLAIPKMAWGFFTHGIPKLILWDYSFLEGEWAIVKWVILYPISAGVVYGMALVFIAALQGIFGRFV